MFDEMTEQEVERLLSATDTCKYIKSNGSAESSLIHKALKICGEDRHCTGMYLLNLGRIIEKVSIAFGEEYKNLPEINLDDIAQIVEAGKGNSFTDISDNLFEYLFAMQREAFRYGYYAALEAES